MITLTLPDANLHEFSLAAVPRQTRGARGPKELRGAVDLGEVISVPLIASLAGDDAVLKHFLQKDASGYRFHLLRLACGFRPGTGESFDQAWLEVGLRREDGAATGLPIAWSMEPRRLVKPIKVTHTVKLGSKLEFLEGEIGGGQEYTSEEIFLEAQREQQPRPVWEFRATKKMDLQGSYLLHLVVRSPAAVATGGDVSLAVAVKQTKYLLFYEQGKLPAGPVLSFRLV